MSEEKTCFIIMPITDVPQYEPDHFKTVYNYIIKPAVEKAGFKPIRADEVQKTNYIIIDILQNIVKSDMCLCDLSARNPNVMYELGIRQAFNLPITLIRDSKTERIFDIQGLRDIEYDENLRIDKVNSVIELISKTILNTFDNNGNDINSLIKLIGDIPSLYKYLHKNDTDMVNPQKYNLESCINKYFVEREREGLSLKTLKTYRYELNLFKEFMNKGVNEYSKEDITSYLLYRNSSITSNNTLDTIRFMLKAFFTWLVDEKIISANPVNRIKPYRLPEVYIEALSDIDLSKIRESCQNLREKALIEVMVSTGCTLSEVINIEINKIDWINNELAINSNKRGTRTAFLTPQAIKALKDYIESRDDNCKDVFVTERRPYRKLSDRSIQDLITKITSRTDITKNITPRTFRHTFALLMLNKGCPMNVLYSLLGNRGNNLTSKAYTKMISNKKQIYEDYFKA